MFHLDSAKIIRDIKDGQNAKLWLKLPYRKEKKIDFNSGLVQELSLSVSAAGEDIVPRVAGAGPGYVGSAR